MTRDEAEKAAALVQAPTEAQVEKLRAMRRPSLTEFLLARIAEDEAWAEAAFQRRFAPIPNAMERPDTAERVLAECEAKRAVVEDFEIYARDCRDAPSEFAAGRRHAALLAVTRLAAVYADHPDYHEAWRP